MSASRLDRAGLAECVAARTGLSVRTSEKAVDAVLEEIYEALKRGECVLLKNFGTFYVRPERESWVFKFNPAQRLRKLFGWSST
jgi:DNA-binding protein HU-beta